MKITAAIIAAALSITAVPATASQFCDRYAAGARLAAEARDEGVDVSELTGVLVDYEKAHPNPKRFVLAVAVTRSAYDKAFSGLTPSGYAYKITQACERGNWEAKYSD